MHSPKNNEPKYKYLYISFFCLIFNYIFYSFIDPEIGYRAVSMNYSNPFVILQGVFMLLFFKDLHFHSKIINTFASTTLGVYAIHEYIFMRSYLWENILDFRKMENFNLLTIILISALIFIVFAIVDLAVQKLFEIPKKLKKAKKN